MKTLYESILSSTGSGMFKIDRKNTIKTYSNSFSPIFDMKQMRADMNMSDEKDSEVILAFLEKHFSIRRTDMKQVISTMNKDNWFSTDAIDGKFKECISKYIKNDDFCLYIIDRGNKYQLYILGKAFKSKLSRNLFDIKKISL
jgi:predicted nucleic-acid-binding protein